MLHISRLGLVLGLSLLGASVAAAQSATITQVIPPENGTYDRSLVLRFTAVFSEPVNVTGAPRLPLDVGGVLRHAKWNAPLDGGAASTLVFEYTPEPYDAARNGIAIAPGLDLNGGAITSLNGAPADVSFNAPNARKIRVALLLPPAPRILAVDYAADATTPDRDLLLLTGTADGGSIVTVQRAGVGVVGHAMAAENGAWAFTYPINGVAGAYHFTATALDSYGLESEPSSPVKVALPAAAGTSKALPAIPTTSLQEER